MEEAASSKPEESSAEKKGTAEKKEVVITDCPVQSVVVYPDRAEVNHPCKVTTVHSNANYLQATYALDSAYEQHRSQRDSGMCCCKIVRCYARQHVAQAHKSRCEVTTGS